MNGLDITIGMKTLGGFGTALLIAGIWLGILQNKVNAQGDIQAAGVKEQVQQGKDIASIKSTLDERTAAILRALERLEAKSE